MHAMFTNITLIKYRDNKKKHFLWYNTDVENTAKITGSFPPTTTPFPPTTTSTTRTS